MDASGRLKIDIDFDTDMHQHRQRHHADGERLGKQAIATQKGLATLSVLNTVACYAHNVRPFKH